MGIFSDLLSEEDGPRHGLFDPGRFPGREGFFLAKDANNLLALLWTWQNADISADPRYGGNFEAALAAIRAKAIVMPASSDLYFPPEDSEYEVAHMPNAELRVCKTDWGHFAGGPGTSPEDIKFLDAALKELLAA
jgi:homoserine O-acetyltransferase/O-succinyltransferase